MLWHGLCFFQEAINTCWRSGVAQWTVCLSCVSRSSGISITKPNLSHSTRLCSVSVSRCSDAGSTFLVPTELCSASSAPGRPLQPRELPPQPPPSLSYSASFNLQHLRELPWFSVHHLYPPPAQAACGVCCFISFSLSLHLKVPCSDSPKNFTLLQSCLSEPCHFLSALCRISPLRLFLGFTGTLYSAVKG